MQAVAFERPETAPPYVYRRIGAAEPAEAPFEAAD